MVRSLIRLKKAFGKENGLKAQDFFDLIDTIVDKTILSLVASDVGLGTTSDPTFNDISIDTVNLLEQDADPDDPDGGKAVLWMSDGTAAGDAGDIMMKISSPAGSGAVTKTVTLIDFSTS